MKTNNANNIILSISLLTSGRNADELQKCLNSLKTIKDHISAEIIIVDTGCDSNTREITSNYADKVINFKWCNDFAKARNAGLEKCTGEWFMFIDDDEWFENTDDIINFFLSGEYKEYGYAKYIQRNYTDDLGKDYDDFWALRLVKRRQTTHFHGIIHEYIVPQEGKCRFLDSFVHHYGYVCNSDKERYNRPLRNVPLLIRMTETEPNDLRWRIQLVQEYIMIGEYGKLIDICNSSLEMINDINEQWVNGMRSAFYIGILCADINTFQYDKTIEDYKKFISDKRVTTVCLAALDYYVICAFWELKDYKNVYKYASEYLNLYSDLKAEADYTKRIERDGTIISTNVFSKYRKEYIIGRFFYVGACNNDLAVVDKCLDEFWLDESNMELIKPFCDGIIELICKTEFNEKYLDYINKLLSHEYIGNRLLICARQIESGSNNKTHIEGETSHIEMLERLVRVFGQTSGCNHWYIIYMKVRYYDMINGKKELVETYRKLFDEVIDIFNLDKSVWEIAERRDIDFGTIMENIPFEKWQKATDEYFAEHGVEQKEKLNLMLDVIGAYDGEKVSYFFLKSKEAEISDISNPIHAASKLNKYCTDCISYCKDIYNSRLFTGDMSLLPAQCRFAIKFTEAKEHEELKPREVMKKLEECKDIYAPFNPALAEFIKVYGERARELLLEEGDIERAKLVVPRLKQMYEIIKKLMEILAANKSGDLRTEITKQRSQMDRMLFDITKSWHCELVDTLSRCELSDEDWLKDTDDMIDLLNTYVNDEDNDFNHTYVVNEEIDDSCRIRETVKNNYEFNYLHAMHLKNYLYGCTNMIVGSSMAMNGIDVDKLDGGNADNISFSISRQDLFYDFMNVKKAVEESARPIKTCVIAAGYDLLYRDLSTDKSQNSTVPGVYYRLFGDEGLHHYDGNTEYLPLAGIDYYYGEYSEAKDFLSASMRWSDDFFISQPTYYNDMMTRTEAALKNGVEKEWKALYPQESEQKAFDSCHSLAKLLEDTKTRDENIGILTDMTKYLYDNGIRIIYLIMPYARKCIRFIDPEFKLRTERVLEKLPYPVEYLDMNDLKGIFTDEDFIDSWNLNELGAEKATKVLREFLNQN